MKTFVLLALLAMSPLLQAFGTFSEAGEKPYIDRKDWHGLLSYNQAWTRAEPNNPTAWYGLGMTYRLGFNQPGDAANSFQRALALNPEWPEAWAQLSAAYSNMQGHHNDVLRTLRAEQQHMSRASSDDWFLLGLNFDNNGSFMDHVPYQEAISAYTQALRMNANRAETWNNRGSAEESLGDNAAALSDFQHASRMGDAAAARNYTGLRQALAAQAAAAAAARQRGSGPLFCEGSLDAVHCGNDRSSSIYKENHPNEAPN
jgi:tetratricopeptide (TPR) repeat protein